MKLFCNSLRISADLIPTSTQVRPTAPQTETPDITYTTGLRSPVRDKQSRTSVYIYALSSFGTEKLHSDGKGNKYINNHFL